jgi:hypothetical protein
MPYPLPLLLIDEKQVLKLTGQGTFKFEYLNFDEVDAIIETHEANDILCCFAKTKVADIVFAALKFAEKDCVQITEAEMKPGQDAIIFKLLAKASEPIAAPLTIDGIEAKKVEETFIYCQLLTRIE